MTAAPCGHADDCPILSTTIELLETPARTIHFWYTDFSKHFIFSKVGLQETVKETRGSDFTSAIWSLYDVCCTQRESGSRNIRCRIGMGD